MRYKKQGKLVLKSNTLNVPATLAQIASYVKRKKRPCYDSVQSVMGGTVHGAAFWEAWGMVADGE